MESIRIDILNPKAKKLLKDLADLDLIRINKDKPMDFTAQVNSIRSNSKSLITLDEITAEVESVRRSRHEKKQGNS